MCDRSVVFQAVGDIALGDHPLCTGFGTHSHCRSKDPGFAFEQVRDILGQGDVLFGNLECTLSEKGLRVGDYHSVQMRGHVDYLAGLRAARVSVVNVANNHSMQHGEEPFLHTVEMLQSSGIGVCGLRQSQSLACRPEVIERNGLRVALLGYSLRPRQYFTHLPLYAEGERVRILEEVRQARQCSDAVIVSMHWGEEFIDRPSRDERELARAIISAGANLLIGHHPHVLRGVEERDGGYIVYSLGNFVCDMLWNERLRESAILQCRLSKRGVSDFRLIPVRINDEYQPVPLHGRAARDLDSRLLRLSDEIRRGFGMAEPEESSEAYARVADAAHRRTRRQSHLYFLKHVHRFPMPMLVQQLQTFAANRLRELRARILWRSDPTG